MADVGRAARVSAQTVSRYFTGTGYVGDATRQRIEAAVAQLGYQPNRIARNLRVNRSETIGVLAVGPLNYGAAAVLSGLTGASRLAQFPLMIAHLDPGTNQPDIRVEAKRAIDGFLSSRVDGIVVTTAYSDTEELLDHVWETVPVVTVSGRPRSTADNADVDSYAAGMLACEHLITLGHRRILHLAGPADRNEAFERARGYRETLTSAGLVPLPLIHGDWSSASGFAAGQAVDPSTFTAVFAGNDQMALGFMSALLGRGLAVPDDYSIIGVDDMPDARYFDPPLSSVFMDFTALGQTAFRMIHHRIHTGERLDRHVITPVLVARASTAAPTQPAS